MSRPPSSHSWPTCPRCRQKLAVFPACPGCGLTLEALDAVFGSGDVVLERVTDGQGVLGETERAGLATEVGALEAAFPQSWAAVYYVTLGSAAALRQFGFWLLNRAALADGDIMRPNENGVVLTIDVPARLTGLTVGYQLEPWLPEATLERVMAAGRKDFQSGRFGGGAARIVRELGLTLRDALEDPVRAKTVGAESAEPLADLRRLVRGDGSRAPSSTEDRHER